MSDLPEAQICTVLVAEDDGDIRRSIAMILESDGFATIPAANGFEALTLLKVDRPDFVLLDLKMPVMSGFEFLKLKAGDPNVASTPVIAITADLSLAAPEGTVALLRKPFELDAFLKLVRGEREKPTRPSDTTRLVV